MSGMMKKLTLLTAVAAMGALVATSAFAAKPGGGNAASSKVVFSKNTDTITFIPFVDPDFNDTDLLCGSNAANSGFDQPNDKLCTPWEPLFDLTGAIKTSNVGALEAVVSLECSLWTDSEASAMIGATGSGGSRAGVEVRVSVDGVPMDPGNIVFCDRLQYIQLTIPTLFVVVPSGSSAGTFNVQSNGPFVVRLFQRTKNAHAYHFYLSTPTTEVHDVLVEVRGIVQCFKDGATTNCSDASIDIPKFIGDGTASANDLPGGTQAVIGKATLVVEEHQNWRILDDGVQ